MWVPVIGYALVLSLQAANMKCLLVSFILYLSGVLWKFQLPWPLWDIRWGDLHHWYTWELAFRDLLQALKVIARWPWNWVKLSILSDISKALWAIAIYYGFHSLWAYWCLTFGLAPEDGFGWWSSRLETGSIPQDILWFFLSLGLTVGVLINSLMVSLD